MAGLDSTGFTPKRLNEILEDIKTRLRSTFGSGTDTNEDEAVMQSITPQAIEIEESWQSQEKVYNNFNPAAAEGVALDNIGAITGTPRIAGDFSTVLVDATGNEGASIPVGFQRSVQDTGEIFELTSAVGAQTLPATGLQPLQFLMTALNDGPVLAVATTLNVGSLPAGITNVINNVDATPGTNDETDEEYRVSRKDRLGGIGKGTVPAIKAALSDVSGFVSRTVLENDTDATDSSGQPAHTIRCILGGGDPQDIVDAIGETKGAGTGTVGNETGTYTDPVDGQEFTINYDFVVAVNIYVDVVVTAKDDDYPANGDTLIETALLALDWEAGEDVILPKLQNAVTSIDGIVTYTLYFNTTATPVVDTTISIDEGQRADFDSTRINVSSP